MVAVPAPTPAVRPIASIVATEGADGVYVTCAFVAGFAFELITLVVVGTVSSTKTSVLVIGRSTLCTGGELTVTWSWSLTVPTVAVMVAVPGPAARTLPVASTEAMNPPDELYVTAGLLTVSPLEFMTVTCVVT